MTVKDILRVKGGKLITCMGALTVYEAVRTMVDNRVGALVVVNEEGQSVGIFTERDVLRLVSQGPEKIHSVLVGDAMTSNLIVGLPGDDVEDILQVMTDRRLRHVPIIEDGVLQGIISIGDIVKAQLKNSKFVVRYMQDYITGKI